MKISSSQIAASGSLEMCPFCHYSAIDHYCIVKLSVIQIVIILQNSLYFCLG